MRNIVRLTERDLTKLVKRVMNEGVIMDYTPEEFKETYKNIKGSFEVSGNELTLTFMEPGTTHTRVFTISC